MQVGTAQCVNKGMQRDYSMDKASQNFAYENRNIRITTTGNESFLSVTNEKSTIPYTPIKVSLSLVSNVDTDKVRWEFFVRALSGTDESVNVTVEFKDINNNIIESKDFSLVKHDTFSYHTDIKAVKATIRSVSAIITNYSASTNVEIVNNCDYIDSNIKGTVVGGTVLGNYLVLFTKDEVNNIDYIYKIDCSDTYYLEVKMLYEGNLGFTENAIECISSYESDKVQKVYWVDGVNQPRYINIAVDSKYPETETFNFTPLLTETADVTITKKYIGTGEFTSGVIQYFITFYKKFGAESNLAYESPLYYVSPKYRGGKPGEKQTCSFNINIKKKENSAFDGIKVYSMLRSSYNTTPDTKLVYEGLMDNNEITIIDEGKGTPVSPTDILFLNRSTISASTIEQKDNTLFLGDVKTLNITEDFIEDINNILQTSLEYEFIYKQLPVKKSDSAYYNYEGNLESPSHILKYFKPREWYRVGVQFKTNTGEWSTILGIRDIQCNLVIKELLNEQDSIYPDENYLSFLEKEMGIVYAPMLKCVLKNNDGWEEILKKYNIVEWRAVMAEHSDSTRTIKAQGLLLPTVFNISEKFKDTCSYTPLWNMGLAQKAKHLENIETLEEIDIESGDKHWCAPYIDTTDSVLDHNAYGESELLKTVLEGKTPLEEPSGNYYLHSIVAEVRGDRAVTISTQDSVVVKLAITVGDVSDSTSDNPTLTYNILGDIVWEHNAFGQGKITCRNAIKKARAFKWADLQNKPIYCGQDSETGGLRKVGTVRDLLGINLHDYIFVDGDLPSEEEVVNKFTPFYYGSVLYLSNGTRLRKALYDANSELIKTHQNEYFFNANTCNFLSPDIHNVENGMNFRIIGGTNINNSISDYTIKTDSNLDSVGNIVKEAIYNVNVFKKDDTNYTGITSLPLWPYDDKMFWINYWQHSGALAAIIKDGTLTGMFDLKSKTFANMWYCNNNTYLDDEIHYPISDVSFISDEVSLFQNKVYKRKYENLIIPSLDKNLYYIDHATSTTPIDKLVENDTARLTANSDIIKTISIQSNSANHCIVNLGNIDTLQYVLPGYRSSLDGEGVEGLIGESFIRTGTDLSIEFYNSLDINDVSIKSGFSNKTVKEILELLSVSTDITDSVIHSHSSDAETLTWRLKFQSFENSELFEGELVFPNLGDNTISGEDNITIPGIASFISDLSYISNRPHQGIIRICDGSSFFNISLYTWVKKTSPVTGMELYPPKYLSVSTQNSLRFNYYSHSIVVSNNNPGVVFKGISVQPSTDLKSKLWIGEFYTEYNKESFMGGENYELNTFIPIYGNYTLPSVETEGVGYGLDGDTYYQRWDYLRIFPTSSEAINQPIDALSIMVETHKNLDGDIREFRGRTNTTTLTEENTNNVLNDVYSQPNNYLTYTPLNKKFNTSYYPTMYVWSLHKQALSTVDNWTQINLVNAAKLDEVRGKLTKIKAWNNKLIAFQDKAIALINFNNQTTISTNEGTPVQIANSGKVSGHYYISTTQGCKNKWSITTSPAGVYFIDSYNKSINLLNDGITSLSTLHLFQDWINENETGVIWNPLEDNSGFKSFYDPIRKDVYFSNNQETLCFNELLNQFVSFYDYSKINTLECIDGHIYSIHNNNLYKMFEGDTYCDLFGEQKDYSITYKINKEPFIDKTWTNIEYRADIFDGGNIADNNSKRNVPLETFDTLEVWNEYQKGVTNLSKAKCKFRIWRADIPRDVNEGRGLNRIRNPWVMLKLSKETNTDKRMEFHDLLVKYLQ